MSIKSHVDPATFVRVLYVDPGDLEPDLAARLERVDDVAAFGEIWKDELARRFGPIFHETYHLWQGVRLPYLHRYAAIAMHRFAEAFRFGVSNFERLDDWQFEVPELHRLTVPFRCWLLDGYQVAMGGSEARTPDDAVAEYRLSERDLLENAASLAEWSVSIADRLGPPASLEPTHFRRWVKRHPAYMQAFEMVERGLGETALALRCTLPMICAAFTTSRPVVAFCTLLVNVRRLVRDKPAWWQRFLAQPEPCRWVDVMESFLDDAPFEAEPDADADLMGGAYCRLTLQAWAFATRTTDGGRFPMHPFLSAMAQSWMEQEASMPQMGWLMALPAWVDGKASEAAAAIEPPLSIARIALPSGRIRVVAFREGIGRNQLHAFGVKDFGDNQIADLLTVASIVKRATGAHFHPKLQLCGHTQCAYHAGNYCNSYPAVPADHRTCTFPDRYVKIRNAMTRRN
jgi:hypothetical protein